MQNRKDCLSLWQIKVMIMETTVFNPVNSFMEDRSMLLEVVNLVLATQIKNSHTLGMIKVKLEPPKVRQFAELSI